MIMTKISSWSLQKCIVVAQLDYRDCGRQYRANKIPSNLIRFQIATEALNALNALHMIQ
jgi:hypothetical protein